MPLSRYQIRNEYSLADPELYRAADKDDPEALLEGVAMAGLVGVLRQLGDLAEFAAEVFHDLHEEVIATAARGHSLMVRVQQLEAEFPSIEKAFLSQTNHSSFFYNAGIDWHPNMRMDQNLITQGDMPRFIMDSYEESRGPPRLFLLDKFDVAGAGACLKRYTDPSFFKMETSALEITNADVQREKRTRKGKKKGSRWRNGETPEVLPTPHAKLHQLLLEERIENTISDPARRIKLKRRLNGFPFDSRTGESYMKKFLKVPSPEHKVVHEISVCSSPLKLSANSTYESGLDVHDINSESPDKKLRFGSPSLTPDMEGTIEKLSMDKFNGIYQSAKGNTSIKEDDVLSTFHEEGGEKEIAFDGKTKTVGSIDGYQSDDVASEVDNYVDALATMESEIDTDSELRSKSDLHVSSNRRRKSVFDATEAEHQQASFSDSLSRGSSMLSEDGNSMFKKEVSSSSYSDNRSVSAENTTLEGEVSTEGLLFDEICEDKGTARPPKQETLNEDMEFAPSAGHANDDGDTRVAGSHAHMSNHRDQSMSNLTILPPTSVPVDAESTLREHPVLEGVAEEMLYAHNEPETELVNDTGRSANLNVCVLSDALWMENDSSPRVFAGNQANNDSDHRYLNLGDSLPCDLSDIPIHGRDASLHADSAKGQLLEDSTSEENLSSLSSINQPLDESGNKSSDMTEHLPKWSPENLPVNGLDREDQNIISGASDDDQDILSDASVYLPNTMNIALEDEKSKNSLGNVPETKDAEDNHMENQVNNLISLPLPIAPLADEQSLDYSLPELETRDGVMESDNKFSAPDDVILPAAEEQLVGQSLRELDTHDIAESDHIVSEADDVTPPAAEVSVCVSSVMESPKDEHSEGLHISRITDDIQPLPTEVNLTAYQIDLPISLISHLDENSLESSVKENAKDAHPKNLQISGITDGIQPPDPATNLTDKQIDSITPAMSHLDEESLDLVWSEFETPSKGAEANDVIPGVNNMISPPGEIAGYIKPIMESPNLCDLRKLQASATLEDVPEFDSTEAGILCNSEQNFHEHPGSDDGMETDGVNCSTDLVERDAADFVIPPDCKSLPSNLNIADADAERDEVVSASHADFDENANDAGFSLSLHPKKDEEFLSKFIESKHNLMEPEMSVQDSDSESDVHKELGTLKFASQDLGSNLSETLRHDGTEAGALGNSPHLCSRVENSINATTSSSPLQQSGLGTMDIPSQKSNLTEYTEDISSSATDHDAEEVEVKLSPCELDKGDTKVLQNADEIKSESLRQLEEEGTSDHLDQEGYTNTAFVSLLANLPSQPSVSELLPEDNSNIGDMGRPKDPFSSSTAFGLLPEANIKLEEMPPLPPLPPVQWRMGKQQHTSSVQEKGTPLSILGAFPSVSSSMVDQKALTLNPFLPCYDIAGESSNLVYEHTSRDPVSEGAVLSQFPLAVHHENDTNRLTLFGETQSVNQPLPLTEKLDKMPEEDFHVGEKVQSRLVTFSQGISVDIASTSKLTDDEPSQLQHQIAQEIRSEDQNLDQGPAYSDGNIAPETSSKDEKLDQGPAQSDGNMVPHDESGQLHHQVAPGTSSEDGKLDQGLAHSDGNIALGTSSEDEKLDKGPAHSDGNIAPGTSSEDEKLDKGPAHSDGNMVTHDKPSQLRHQVAPQTSPEDGKLDQGPAHSDGNIAPETSSKDEKLNEGPAHSDENMVIHDKPSQLQHHVAPEISSQYEKLDQGSAHSDGNIFRYESDVLPSKIENDQTQNVMSSPMEENRWPAQDDGKANGGRTTKLPRPRNPLIDAVVAHDKSKLKKVAERPRPQIHKADERDSLLEQIRAKSFNLKPAVVSRPSIQGPTTNLRVAAILEKAKTIRQAFAGSDEDDDDDSWSDS